MSRACGLNGRTRSLNKESQLTTSTCIASQSVEFMILALEQVWLPKCKHFGFCCCAVFVRGIPSQETPWCMKRTIPIHKRVLTSLNTGPSLLERVLRIPRSQPCYSTPFLHYLIFGSFDELRHGFSFVVLLGHSRAFLIGEGFVLFIDHGPRPG